MTGKYEIVELTGSAYYDAYLFPEALAAPATTVHVTTEGGMLEPSGQVRLTPVASSELIDGRAGVGNQIWSNDEDLQFRSAVKDLAGGSATFGGDELVYGVEYLVTVHGVTGYQVASSYFVAGFDGDPIVTLRPFERALLEVVYDSAIEGTAVQWNALDQLIIRPAGADGDHAVSVANLLGTNSVEVLLVAAP